MTTATSITTTLRRRRGLTEEAANAAIDQACRRLRLPTIRAVVDEATTAANKEQLSYQGFLAELLLAECDDRDRRSSVRRVKAAGFPRDKWLGDFDFDANPNINPATINTLATAPSRFASLATLAPAKATCSWPRHCRCGEGVPGQIHARHPARERTRRGRRREEPRPNHRTIRPGRPADDRRTRLHETRPKRRRTPLPGPHRTGGEQLDSDRLERVLLRLDEALH